MKFSAIVNILMAIFLAGICIIPGFSQRVDIEVTTKSHGGVVAPRNAAAVWIETADSKLVNTVEVWSYGFNWCLYNWRRTTGLDSTGMYDGITAATRPGHDTAIAVFWDCKDTAGNLVPHGTYKFCAEMTEDEYYWKTKDPNEIYKGRYACGTIAIDGQAKVVKGDSTDTCMTNLTASYIPVGIVNGLLDTRDRFRFSCWYNAAAGNIVFQIPAGVHGPTQLRITNMKGALIKTIGIRPGSKVYTWDMLSTGGVKKAAGVYIAEIRQAAGNRRIGSAQTVTVIY